MGDLSGVPPFRGDIGLDDLRRRNPLFVACLVVPFGLLVAFSRPAATDAWVPLTAIALFAIAGMTYLACDWRVSAGAATVVVGLVGIGHLPDLGRAPALDGASAAPRRAFRQRLQRSNRRPGDRRGREWRPPAGVEPGRSPAEREPPESPRADLGQRAGGLAGF